MRYGHLMVMTDQDHDGSHIKGLIINFLHCYWPNLLKQTDFLREFVTPIVKVSKAKQAIPFFTLKEYEDWRIRQAGADKVCALPSRSPRLTHLSLTHPSPPRAPRLQSWTTKYYKGLGTSTSIEAKQYFSDLPQHELTFTWGSDQDGALIEKAFAKSMADARKEWLRGYDPQVGGTQPLTRPARASAASRLPILSPPPLTVRATPCIPCVRAPPAGLRRPLERHALIRHLHRQRAHPLFQRRQRALHPLVCRRPQARPAQDSLRLLQARQGPCRASASSAPSLHLTSPHLLTSSPHLISSPHLLTSLLLRA